jgi:hypothetical protein
MDHVVVEDAIAIVVDKHDGPCHEDVPATKCCQP